MVARPEAQPAWYGVRGDVHRRACWHMLLYRSWPAWESYWRGRAFHLAQDIHALFFTLFMCSWRQKADLGFESVLGAPAVDSVGSSVTGCPLFHNGADSELYKTFLGLRIGRDDQLSQGVKDRGAKWLREDVGQLASGANMVQDDVPLVAYFPKEGDARGDVLQTLG